MERRFQKVIVEEPTPAESIEILKGVRDYYEQHHHVTYADDVVETAVRMADRGLYEANRSGRNRLIASADSPA